MNKKLEKSFYIWFTFVPLFCILLDLFFATIEPDTQYPQTVNFDFSIINQSVFLSVWVSVATSAYGIVNWIHMDWKNMPSWAVGKNNLTSLVTLNVITFIIYNVTLTVQKDGVAGFSTWYNIIKSVLEHMFTPILILAFYFSYKKQFFSTNEYITKYSWFNLIFIGIYCFYIIVRFLMLQKYAPATIDPITGQEVSTAFNSFPYVQIDPRRIGWALFGIVLISTFVVVWGISVFFNWSSNKFYKQEFNWNKKANIDYKKQL